MKKQKVAKELNFGKMLAWQTRGISFGIQVVLLSFMTIYCTNALGMEAVLVGTIAMISKIFDGFTDLFAGYLVDRTKTKWGKGRPYEFAILGLWLTTWLLFSVPEGASMVVKCVWIFIAYAMAQSVFATLLNANQNVYMVRAFRTEESYVKLNSLGGLIVTIGVMIFNVIFPIFEAKIIYSASGWSRLIGFIAVPLAIIGMMRFLFIKEREDVVIDKVEKVNLKDVAAVLKNNKYIYLVAVILFISAVSGSMGIGNYYFLYIVGNVEISGVMGLFGVLAMVTMAFYPKLMKKLSAAKLIQLGCLFSIPGGIILFIANKNLALLAIGGVISGVATLPISFMVNLLIIECATYNEWQDRPRMEGALTSITSFANKLGSAFGSLLIGAMLSAAKFDGTLKVQPESATLMLRFIYAILPMIFGVIIIILLRFYKIDKFKKQMETECEAKRAALSGDMHRHE